MVVVLLLLGQLLGSVCMLGAANGQSVRAGMCGDGWIEIGGVQQPCWSRAVKTRHAGLNGQYSSVSVFVNGSAVVALG